MNCCGGQSCLPSFGLDCPLELLDELGLEHGILAAGDAHGHPISRLNEFVSLHRGDEGVP